MGALRMTWGRATFVLLTAALCFGVAACQPAARVCPERGAEERLLRGDELQRARMATPAAYGDATRVMLGGRELSVDKVVSGPLCNDNWHGTIYVDCDVRVPEWTETPVFLRDCQLEVEPGTIVYVAAHNNSAYYQGCSCHTGEIGTP